MNQAQMNARVGIFFVVGVALIWMTFQALHDGSFTAKDGYTVTAAFKSLRELKVGNDVRMAGVAIGTVESVRLDPTHGHAEAVLLIRKEYSIARDATATISMSGLVGSNYIALDIGTPAAGFLAPGEALRTRDAPDLNDIMTQLGGVGDDLRQAISKIGSAFGENPDGTPGLVKNLNTLVTENRGQLAATISNLNEITTQIRAGQGTLGKLINDPAAYDTLLNAVGEIKNAAGQARAFIADTQGIVADVKSGRGAIGTLLYDEETAKNLKISVRNITDITAKMTSESSTFGKLITDDSILRDAKATLRKVDRAMDGFADSGPITAVGILANGLF